MKLAILGTGKMGAAMARRLDKGGHEVVLWNRTAARAEQLGVGTVMSTPADAAAAAEVVLTVLTGPVADREVYEGPKGALAAAEGRLFIDVTTGGPANAEYLDAAVRARGGRYLEAPVLGGPAAIESGKLMILAGGDAADLDEARGILSEMGQLRHVGTVGAAARLKLIANSMLAVISAEAAELQAAGESAGVSRDDVYWALQRMAPSLETRRAGYLEQRYHPVAFALRDMVKDIDLALEVYRDAGAETPLLEATREVYGAVAEEHAGDDMSAVNSRYRHKQDPPRRRR